MNAIKNKNVLYITIVAILSLMLIAAVGCQGDTATPTVTTAPTNAPSATSEPTATGEISDAATAEPTTEATVTPTEEPTFIADGQITDGEYPYETTVGSVLVAWNSDGFYLYMALQAETDGWIAIGLDPENRMEGANYIIAYVDDNGLTIDDQYGTSSTSHASDIELGGTNDLVAYGATELDGVTTVEFQFPIDSSDEYDKIMTPGETYPIIVATGKKDDLESMHNYAGEGEITLSPMTY